MPEGPLLHYLQRRHQAALVGQRLAVDSPQGPFAEGARALDGRRLEAVGAHGKRLFYRFAGGRVLHVHLGLFGHFTEAAPAGPPRASCRAALSAFGGPIGLARMEQGCVSGVGNILRAEALFLAGLHPTLPARGLPAEAHARLWKVLVRMMRASVRTGTLRTLLPADARRLAGGRTAKAHGREDSYVYGRTGKPCLRCGSAVEGWAMAGRGVWACPRCQPAPSRRGADAGKRTGPLFFRARAGLDAPLTAPHLEGGGDDGAPSTRAARRKTHQWLPVP